MGTVTLGLNSLSKSIKSLEVELSYCVNLLSEHYRDHPNSTLKTQEQQLAPPSPPSQSLPAHVHFGTDIPDEIIIRPGTLPPVVTLAPHGIDLHLGWEVRQLPVGNLGPL